MRNIGIGLFLAVTAGFAALLATPAMAQSEAQMKSFDLPAQDAAAGIAAFAHQADIQLLISATDAKDRRTNALHGAYSVEEALAKLLEGSGLVAEATGPGTYTVLRSVVGMRGKPSATTPAAGPLTPLTLAQAQPAGSSAGNPSTAALEEVLVTGTHIRGASPTGSPLTVYDRASIERSGATSVDQFMRTLPQNFSNVDAGTARISGGNAESNSNGFYGAAVNLHGLGNSATLVLVNGHRLAPAGNDGAFVDISMIPLSAVERVEVLADGASAIYGADAVAGVVNFVLRTNYRGAETSVRFADTTEGGSAEKGASQLLGGSWNGGSAMLVYEYRDQHPLFASDRDFVPTGPGGLGDNYTLLTADRRNSGFLSAHQALGARTTLSGNAYITQRNFSNTDISASRVVETYITGTAKQTGGGLAVAQELPGEWHLNFTADYSKLEQDQTQRDVAFGTFQPFGYDSRLIALDARSDGRLFALPGGDVRASLGIGGRKESFDVAATLYTSVADLDRKVWSAYGELLVPFFGSTNARSWAKRLDLSLAVRHDHYNDFGSATKPKVGLSWQPIDPLTLRATYARAFRAPTLSQLHDQTAYQLISIPDALAPGGYIDTIFFAGAGNESLKPERSRSWTAGFDLQPTTVPSLTLSSTFFSINYADRIAGPPLIGTIFDIYSQPAVSPFVTRPVDPQVVQDIASGARGSFLNFGGPDFSGIDPALTDAFFDFRPANIAVTRESGLDVSARYGLETTTGNVDFFLGGTRLFTIKYRSTPTVPVAELLNLTYRPMDLRMQGAAQWSRGPWSSALTLHYSAGYTDDLITPNVSVSSWLTADAQIRYDTKNLSVPALLQDTSVSLSVLNLTDEDPPFVPWEPPGVSFNYDPSNASPRGRFIALHLTRRW